MVYPPGKGGIFGMALTKTMFVGIILIVLLAMSIGIASAAAKEQAKETVVRLTASDPVGNAQFGRSVAMAGDLVAVGEGGDGAVGAVYLYKRQGLKYIPEATLTAPDAVSGDTPEFGRTVAIQGNTVFVGARFAQAGSLKRAGAVYVFRKHGNTWQYENKIVSPSPEDEDNFGRALAIQGNLLVITARKTANEEGAAYIFTYSGGNWVHQADLVAGDSSAGAYFGQSVDIQGDVIAIGARNATPNEAGAVYLFRQSGSGWKEIAKVTPQNGKKNDQYGFTIDLSGDMLTVGARRADLGTLADTGAAYVYSVKGDSVELVTKLTPEKGLSAFDEFGQSVAVAGDIIAVGAWKDDNKQGSVYLFRRHGGRWIETGKITAPDGKTGDEFGYSLAAFGNRLVTGAHFADAKAGAAYVLPLKP
jgi:hypothetical protein